MRIDYPRGGYAPVFAGAGNETSAKAAKTIAVPPFANLGSEAANDYFSDGLTQELIHVLTRLPGLQVLAWNSVARLREQGQAAKEIGERLPVDAVLEGTVRRSGARVRIAVQLVEVKSGLYVWAETYERQLRDLFAVQEELARSIAEVLKVRLSNDATGLRPSAGSVEAYSLYLRGRHAWSRRTEESLRQSIAFYRRAIEEDARCALAYAGLADAHCLLCDFGFAPAADNMAAARKAALQALAIDPRLAEAHNSLGFIFTALDWNWELGERHYLEAIEYNPGYATAHHWYGIDWLALRGRMEKAAAELAIARQLNPLDAALFESENYLHLIWRKYGEAERRYRQLLLEAPDFYKAYSGLGRVLAAQGRYRESIEMLERARSLAGDTPSFLSALGQVHAMDGNRGEARRMLELLGEIARPRHVSAIRFALVHLGLGERDEALAWLERGCDRRELPLTAMGVHPAYDDLRGEPRFKTLLEKMNFWNQLAEMVERMDQVVRHQLT